MINEIILTTYALQVKHFVVDFLLQTKYQYLNKGKYLHPGGLLHSGLHAIATGFIGLYFVQSYSVALIIGLFDLIIHYHVDWAKVQINTRFNLQCNTSEQFWYLVGLDQLLHQLTYIAIIFYMFKS